MHEKLNANPQPTDESQAQFVHACNPSGERQRWVGPGSFLASQSSQNGKH